MFSSQHNDKKRHFWRAEQWPYLVKHIHIHHTHTHRAMCCIRNLVCCVSSSFDSTPARWLDDVWRRGNWFFIHFFDVFVLSWLFFYIHGLFFLGEQNCPLLFVCEHTCTLCLLSLELVLTPMWLSIFFLFPSFLSLVLTFLISFRQGLCLSFDRSYWDECFLSQYFYGLSSFLFLCDSILLCVYSEMTFFSIFLTEYSLLSSFLFIRSYFYTSRHLERSYL